jgi:hypothetical protein
MLQCMSPFLALHAAAILPELGAMRTLRALSKSAAATLVAGQLAAASRRDSSLKCRWHQEPSSERVDARSRWSMCQSSSRLLPAMMSVMCDSCQTMPICASSEEATSLPE